MRPTTARAGGARLPRAGLVARPRARPDAKLRGQPAATSGLVTLGRRPRQGQEGIAGDWAAPRDQDRRTRGLSGARPPDRAAEKLRPTTRPGDGATRLPQRRGDLRRRAGPGDDHQYDAGRGPPARPARSPNIPACSTASSSRPASPQGSVGERLAALNTDPAQLYADTDAGRAELIAEPQRQCEDDDGPAAQGLRHPAQPAARNPPRAAGNPGRRAQRLLQQRLARWLAPGDLLDQPEVDPRLAEIFAAVADLSRGRPRPSPADQPGAGVEGHSDAAQDQLLHAYSKAGRSMPSSSPTSSAAMRASSAPAICSPSCSAPRGWSSTPASTPRAGAARRRSTTWSPPPASPRPRVQREVERYCVSIGQACSYKVGHLAWLRARDRPRRPRRQVRHQAVPRSAEGRRDAADHPRTAGKGTCGDRRLSPDRSGEKWSETACSVCQRIARLDDHRGFLDHRRMVRFHALPLLRDRPFPRLLRRRRGIAADRRSAASRSPI